MKKDWTGNYHSLCGTVGAHNESTEPREINDYYATDPIAAEWLIKIEELAPYIWECACGEGHLARVFEDHGYNVHATDLIDRGYGIGGIDFLNEQNLFIGDIVTNPPYKYAQKFVEHALELVQDGHKVCMFLRLSFLEGARRKKLFEKAPPARVWVSSARIHCGKNGEFKNTIGMVAFAWFVWEKGYTGEPVIKWFN